MANEALAKRYLELGALFVAVGVDTTLLARGAEALAARFGAEKTVRRVRRLLSPPGKRSATGQP